MAEGKKTITVQEKFRRVDQKIRNLEAEVDRLKSGSIIDTTGDLISRLDDIEKRMTGIGKGDRVTLVCFSGDFDRITTAFILANGAVAMGAEVTMFFTFWGLNALKKKAKTGKKSFLQRLFGIMLPRGTRQLPTSRFNFLGIGPMLFRYLMKHEGILSLEELVESAIDMDVTIITCEMTKNLLGIKDEELIAPFPTGGVATYLKLGLESQLNLFI